MKKQLFLIGLIFTMFVAYSQTTETKSESQPTATADTVAESKDDFCPHRILFRFGGGYANNNFKDLKKEIDGLTRCSYTAMAEIGYTYFFHRNVGIGIGVGINYSARIAKINENITLYDLVDPLYYGDLPYDLTYSARDLKQRMGVWAIEVPLTVQFEEKFGGKNGIYAGVGVKGYFPISTKAGFTGGEIDITRIYDRNLNVTYNPGLTHHMEPLELKDKSVKTKMRPSIDILGEFGGIFGLARSTDFYVGVYASYGFLNILPKEGVDLSTMNVGDRRFGDISNRYVNSSDKWNLLQVGLKLGFHFLPCKANSNKEYMRDAKRRYMDEMIKKQNEPIVVTNTVQEFYYYIVPTIADDLLDEASADKKKALLDLAQSLSMIKILFDLDKDIPKLSDRNKEDIKNAVAILKANPDLKIIITGYTSPEGSQAHNQDLAQRRANAVRGIFVNEGVPKDQIATQAFTAQDPQHKIDIPEREEWSQQRAVIFRIEKK
ncbi:MAG: OmpA family protein [Bacteroidetes bacterium]|nr:OmpA family protein [Bacteroidota bacterium]MCL2302124.1 OmpA family protein [Lentimicrobiaceae bacterium]